VISLAHDAADRAHDRVVISEPIEEHTMSVTSTSLTGQTALVTIMRIPDGDAYIAVASAAGASTHPAWYLHLIAHPRVHVQDHAEHLDVIAREVSGAEKQRLWAIAETYWPHFPEYREKAAGREIPIFRLEPVVDPAADER
jgi:deazaflavin-dependent oxidoreductase (nitroreductase family)